ncbi:MAG: hypothetical protein C5B49_13735 [Bdellovibrio sp.]|nr:MAG: hypothetical protein C5B49_13735 [Bdellovibrio sp.]
MGLRNQISDRLWDDLDTILDFGERKRRVLEFSHAIASELPVIPLVYPMEVSAIPANLKGYVLNPSSLFETNEIENWEFE